MILENYKKSIDGTFLEMISNCNSLVGNDAKVKLVSFESHVSSQRNIHEPLVANYLVTFNQYVNGSETYFGRLRTIFKLENLDILLTNHPPLRRIKEFKDILSQLKNKSNEIKTFNDYLDTMNLIEKFTNRYYSSKLHEDPKIIIDLFLRIDEEARIDPDLEKTEKL